MDGVNFTMTKILVNDDNNWANLWLVQSNRIINEYWFNLIITNALNGYIPVWVCIYDSIILTNNYPIGTIINQWLSMCATVSGHIDKLTVNQEMQFSTNSDILKFLCRTQILTRWYLTYICRRYLFYFRKVGEYQSIISTDIIRIIFYDWINIGRVIIGVTKIKMMGNILDNITKGNIIKIDMRRRLMGCFRVTQNGILVWFW